MIRRIALFAAALLTAVACLAAPITERSAFRQGHWWNPAQPGSGFDVFEAAGEVMAVWYTYDEAGRAVWYTAQGRAATLGREAWPLLRHRWVDGRKAPAATVGTLRFTPATPETAEVAWELGGRSGRVPLQPFLLSGVVNEADYTGSWFVPESSGWGVAITHQGDAFGSVLFTYDAAGDPTWAAGFGHDPASAELFAFTGSCPGCAPGPRASRPVGRLAFDLRSESEIVARSQLSLPMAAGVAVDGARLRQLSRPASSRPADRQLASFSDLAALRAFVAPAIARVRHAATGVDFSPAPPATTTPFSPTNLQESGVDEDDLVKSDGRRAYTFAYDGGRRQAAVRMAEIGEGGASVRVVATAPLASPAPGMAYAGLYLDGERLVAITGTRPPQTFVSGWTSTTAWADGTTRVEVFDAPPAAAPRSRWRIEIDGHPVATRRIGSRVYVVSRFVPRVPGLIHGASSPAALEANARVLETTPVERMLPAARIDGAAPVPVAPPEAFFAPPAGSTLPSADMIVVSVIDIVAPRLEQALVIVGAAETVYASDTAIYLATARQDLRTPTGNMLSSTSGQYTDVHQLRLVTGGLAIGGSATLEGFLASDLDRAQFRLSEHQGRLRVVTSRTVEMGWGLRDNVNRLTILEPSATVPGLLKTVSFLPNARRPEGLGKPLEELYATRFLGDRLYAVTFTSAALVGQVPFVDPLYVVDLADARDPRIRGELVIPGFSDYLHPLGNGLLVGFGRSVTERGVVQGLQLSLFDVSDDARPRALHQVTLGRRGSDSALLQSHHAFSILPAAAASLLAFPARLHDGEVAQGTGDTAVFRWQESGLLRYRVSGTTPASARLEELPRLVTHRSGSDPGNPDPAAEGARSILFPDATVYVAGGRFWRQDGGGNLTGPF